jgi:hypothetical protein
MLPSCENMVLKPTLVQEWIDDGCTVDEAMSLVIIWWL